MWEQLDEMIIKIVIAFLVTLLGSILAKFIKKFIIRLSKNVEDKGALTFIGSCASITIRIVFVVVALAVLGFDMSIVVGSLSAISLGISLALRDTMNDVAGGIQILFTKPFVIGDYIQVGQYEGTVIRIEILFTVLQTFDHQEIIIPNSTAVSQILTNFSKEPYRRIHISFPVSLQNDVQKCLKVGHMVLDSEKDVIEESLKKEVVVDGIGEKEMKIGIYCFVPFDMYWSCLCRMNTTLLLKRKETGIIPVSSSIQIQSGEVK